MTRKCMAGILVAAALLSALAALLLPLLRPVGRSAAGRLFPSGAQLLCYPAADALITADFLNPVYREKNGYQHYGLDLAARRGGRFASLAVGQGRVLGVEFCDNAVGNVAVVAYDAVYRPATGGTGPLIARYYHMLELAVGAGDEVAPGQPIGWHDSAHEWYNHVHLELDGDVEHPFHTPQVAEGSSALLHRYPASGDSLLNPVELLALGSEQSISVHPGALWAGEGEAPLRQDSFRPKSRHRSGRAGLSTAI